MNNTILELNNIIFYYGNIQVLKNINLKVYDKEIVALIGANGAGKSTLLKTISGLEYINGGNIIFNNNIIQSPQYKIFNTADNIARIGIKLVPEGRGIFTELTVLENLEMGAYLIKDKNLFNKKLEFVYSLFPLLKDRRNQRAGYLSGGEQQMLAISRALMGDIKLLLLDEPGLGLSPIVTQNIFNIIKEINENSNIPIILVEQNAKLALKYSNRAYVIENGNIAIEGESKNLLNDPRVKSAYLGENV